MMAEDTKRQAGDRVSKFSHADRRTWQAETWQAETWKPEPWKPEPPQERFVAFEPPSPFMPPEEKVFANGFSLETLPGKLDFPDSEPPIETREAAAAPTSPSQALTVAAQPPRRATRAAIIKARAAAAVIRRGASVVARNANRSQLEQKYFRALSALHKHIFDRRLEQLFFRPTVTAKTENALVPQDGSAQPFVFDGPVPRLVFNWAMAALPRDVKTFAFVDFRAQRGRAAMLAARRNFERIIAFEHDAETADDLQMNVAQFPRSLMACRNIEVVRADLNGIAVPDQPLVLYFSNAFREKFMSLIMNHVSTSYRLHPRRMYIILENPPPRPDLGPGEIFYRIDTPLRERALAKVLSPVRLEIYRSLV